MEVVTLKNKFLMAVLNRSLNKIMVKSNKHLLMIHEIAANLLTDSLKPNAIEDQAQAHGEGRLKR